MQQANQNRESIESICPHRFRAALAPHRAARLEGKSIRIEDLLQACQTDRQQCLIVEGAGGFYSPLADNGLNADLATLLQLPVIIVVNDRIGAVNQALMTIEAVQQRQLPVAAIIMNQVEADIDPDMDNKSDLAQHCDLPIFSCSYEARMESIFQI